MRRTFNVVACLFILVALAAPAAHAAGADCPIILGSCHRQPLSSPAGDGILDRLAIEAFRRIGLKACIEALPCERSLMNADAGLTDGDILRIPSVIADRYPNLVGVSEPLYVMPMSGFVARTDLQPQSLADLAPLRVGYILGWKILEDKIKAASVLRVRGPEELFPLLTNGKADVVVYEGLTGLALVREMGLAGIRVVQPPLIVTPQFLVLHRRHQGITADLATAIRAMKADGSYDKAFRDAGYRPLR